VKLKSTKQWLLVKLNGIFWAGTFTLCAKDLAKLTPSALIFSHLPNEYLSLNRLDFISSNFKKIFFKKYASNWKNSKRVSLTKENIKFKVFKLNLSFMQFFSNWKISIIHLRWNTSNVTLLLLSSVNLSSIYRILFRETSTMQSKTTKWTLLNWCKGYVFMHYKNFPMSPWFNPRGALFWPMLPNQGCQGSLSCMIFRRLYVKKLLCLNLQLFVQIFINGDLIALANKLRLSAFQRQRYNLCVCVCFCVCLI